MKLPLAILIVFASHLPMTSFGGTQDMRSIIRLGDTFELSAEQKSALEAQLQEVKSRCRPTSSNPTVEINQIVNQIYPFTGIPLTAIVVEFLLGKGVTSYHEGQITLEAIRTRDNTISSELRVDRTIEVSYSCVKKP